MKQLLLAFLPIFCLSISLADDVRQQTQVVQDPTADYLELCGWEFAVVGGGYSVWLVDVNNDDIKDQFFANAATSGTGGMSATIYLSRADNRFLRAGTIGHGSIALVEDLQNGNLLHCGWSFGGGDMSITSYRITAQGVHQIDEIPGRTNDVDFSALYSRIFERSLNATYKFVPNHEIQAEQGAAANP